MSGDGPTHRWPVVGREADVAAILARLDDAGVLLVGPAGVGKTALAAELASLVAATGRPTIRLVATTASRPVPFGALAPLLAIGATNQDRREVRAGIERAVRSEEGAGPMLVVVDDAPLLDPASADVLVDLLRRRLVTVLATARRSVPLSAELDAAVVEGALVRHPVEPLDARQVRAAAEAALRGPLVDASAAALWVATQGIPLYARELVEVNLSSGGLTLGPDGWELADQPTVPPSLLDLVASRVVGLDAVERGVFEVLALAQPLPLEPALALAGSGLLSALEQAGLIVLETVGGEPVVRLGHPLYDEVVRSTMGPLHARHVAERAVAALESIGGDDPDLLLRTACLRAEHQLEIGADHAVVAARRAMALVDPGLAISVLEHSGSDSFEVLLALGTALTAAGRVDDADEVLRLAVDRAVDDRDRARVVSRRGTNLGNGGGRFADAATVLAEGLGTIDDPRWRSFVAADLAYARLWLGQVDAPAAEPAADPALDPVRANECLVGAVVAVMGGELRRTEELVVEGLPLVSAIRDDVPTARELLSLSHFLALAFAGDRRGADELVAAELERCVGRSEAAPGTWFAVRSMQRLIDGDAAGAIGDALDAEQRLELVDITGLRPLATAVRATALAWLGRSEESRAVAASVDEVWREETKVRLELEKSAAWRAAVAGDTRGAARALVAAGRVALDANHLPLGAIAAYDAVRLGHPRVALPVLRAAVERWEGPLATTLVRHAEALVEEDPERLLGVARALPTLGFTIPGAEAAIQAARLLDWAGRGTEARHAEFVAATIAAPFPDLRSPTLGTPRGLTRREQEVVDLAAAGHRSRDIAERLGISVRTVENHLGAAYRKLGIRTRGELGGNDGDGREVSRSSAAR